MAATGGTAARSRRRRTLTSALSETGTVLVTAAKLLWRHWPVLFALYFAGVAIREFSFIGAVQASKINDVLGMLVLILGPVATLAALVLMLRALLPSLPWLAAAASGRRSDGTAPRKTLMDYLASALVPFLAVYASWGYLREDVSNYFYEVWADTALSDPAAFTNPSVIGENLRERLPWDISTTLVVVVVFAVLLRWLLSQWQGVRRWPVLGILGAYVEVIWILVTMATLNSTRDPVTQWVRERKVVQWLLDLHESVVSSLGPFTGAARAASEWMVTALSSADTVIVVPLAWLAVGAVVYGYRLAEPGPPASELLQRASSRWRALPRPVRVVGTNLTTDLRDRFTPLVHGLRLMFRAGLAPMLFFCLAFLIAQTAREWMWEAERLIIGPRELQSIWMPISGPLSMINDAVGVVLLACLLGAAVDQVLRHHPPPPPPSPSP